jgi:hypothetical protein
LVNIHRLGIIPVMGAFFVNYQIKSGDQDRVAAAAAELIQGRAYVSPPKNGWITLYDEISDQQDAYEIGRLGSELSAQLKAVVFAFVVNDSAMFVYYLFDNGDLLDEYNSAPPPTSEDADADQKVRFAGRPDILLNYCPPGFDRSLLEVALMRGDGLIEGGFAENVYAEERLHPLTQALGMDDLRTTLGFSDFDRRVLSIPQGREFAKLDGKKIRRPGMRRVPPPIPRPPR